MKKIHFLLFIAIQVMCVSLFSCDNDTDEPDDELILRDFITFSVAFIVTDGEENNLADPGQEGNILNYVSVEYKNETYHFLEPYPGTRDNMAAPLAIRSTYYPYYKTRLLTFGEFSPVSNHNQENFTIDWGDGTKDEITFDCYITWDNKEPRVHSNLFFNGKEVKGYPIQITKDNYIPEKELIETTDYTLPGNFDRTDMKTGELYVIRTEEELTAYMTEGDLPEIDFSAYSLLCVRDHAEYSIPFIKKRLYKDKAENYQLYLNLYREGAKEHQVWETAILVPALPKEAEITFQQKIARY